MYQKAEVYLRNNFMAKALEQYLLVVERFPHSPQAPMALYQIGQIQLRTNAFDQALYYFNLLASEHPDDPLAVEAYFEMGVCQQRLGRYDQAVQSFGYYVHADRAKRPDEAKILLGDSYVVLRRYGDALLAYASCDPHLDSARQVDVLKKVRDLLEGKIQLTELLGLIPRLNDGPVADFARFRAAEELMSHGQQAEAARLLRRGGRLVFLRNTPLVIVCAPDTGQVDERRIESAVRKNFPLTPRGIIETLKLRRPIFRATAAFGHFGREEKGFEWEKRAQASRIWARKSS